MQKIIPSQSVVVNSGLNKLNAIPLNRSVTVKKTNIDKIINECNIPLQIKKENQKKTNEITENINYLHNLQWSNKAESNNHILKELMKDVFENEKDLFAFKQYLDSLQLSNTYCDDVLKYNSIGPLHKYDKDDKLFWRKVKGDGNCFYRGFLFAFFENIIFTSNISYLVSILYDFKLKINKTKFREISVHYGFNVILCFKCLLMLYLSMISKSRDTKLKSYTIFIKMLNNIKDFDYGLISYFHFLIFEFIENNQDNHYSEVFNVKIGNLLPKEYEDENGNQNFNLFYDNFLFKLFTEAEKIIIYISPFIFNIELNLYYENSQNPPEEEEIKTSLIDSDSEEKEKQVIKQYEVLNFKPENNTPLYQISLLYRRTHYDVLYSDSYYEVYKTYLNINFAKEIKEKNNKNRCFLCDREKDIYFINDTIIICQICLVKEIQATLKMYFTLLIQNNRKHFLNNFNEGDLKELSECDLNVESNQVDITIGECVDMLQRINVKWSFDNFIYDIKCFTCLMCDKPKYDGKKYTLKLPCDCRLCSTKCLNDFMVYVKSTMNIKNGVYCLCGKKYVRDEIKKMYILFQTK